MSDDTSTKAEREADRVPRGQIQAEGTLSGADDAAVYSDIADVLLDKTTSPLRVAHVQRWPRDGHTIVLVACAPNKDGTRKRQALATAIEEWQPVEDVEDSLA